MLSQLQIEFFRKAGYLLLKDQVPQELILEARDIALTMEWSIPAVIKNGKPIKVYGIYQRGLVAFNKIIQSSQVLDPLESLLGPNIEFLLNRHNSLTFNRRAEISERLHRDVLQWTKNILTVMVYLDKSSIQNGCTRIIPTSQFLPFVGTPNNGGTWMDEHSVYHELISQSVPVEAELGDILIFDSLAFHTVGENHTEESRMSLILGYTAVDELLPLEKNNPYRLLVRGERLYRGNLVKSD